ncbi:YolD-like family protein [Paenibacillus peoriae]|nr:YolD-like family protein [Paenibacillus peoriae]
MLHDEPSMWHSRFILPEHRESMLQQEKESRRKVMPVLDEQEKEDIGQKLAMSLKLGREITIRIFGEFEDRTLTGTVIQMDQQTRQARISIGIDDWERVPFSVILGAED